MTPPWEPNFWPEWVWHTLENLAVFAAIVAFFGAVVWLWNKGPGWAIKYGGERMTRFGHREEARRQAKRDRRKEGTDDSEGS